MLLGDPSFYRAHILDERNGTYDLFAFVDSASTALGSGASSIRSGGDLFFALSQLVNALAYNNVGLGAMMSSVADLVGESSRHFRDRYLQAPGFSTLFLSEYELGNNTQTDELNGTRDADIIHAGGGDDVINGSADPDIIDGGAGDDTLDYRTVDERLTVRLDTTRHGDLGLLVRKGSKGIDRGAGIEHLRLGDQADYVRFDGFPASGRITVDGGGQPSGQRDVLDLRQLGSGATVTRNPADARP